MDCIAHFDRRSQEDDFYSVLGCRESSTVEQILAEYRHRALLYHPDKGTESDRLEQFQKLQEAKEVLCDPVKRKEYDQWKHSGIAIPYKQWVSMKKTTNVVFHWAVSKPEGNMLESGQQQQPVSSLQQSSTNHSHPQHWSTTPISFQTTSRDSLLHKFRTYQI